jgi:hypothetical protein
MFWIGRAPGTVEMFARRQQLHEIAHSSPCETVDQPDPPHGGFTAVNPSGWIDSRHRPQRRHRCPPRCLTSTDKVNGHHQLRRLDPDADLHRRRPHLGTRPRPRRHAHRARRPAGRAGRRHRRRPVPVAQRPDPQLPLHQRRRQLEHRHPGGRADEPVVDPEHEPGPDVRRLHLDVGAGRRKRFPDRAHRLRANGFDVHHGYVRPDRRPTPHRRRPPHDRHPGAAGALGTVHRDGFPTPAG